jgi:acetolactate synthase I/II/III large subunit
MKMKVSDYIIEYLSQQGVTHIYEVIGGMITHLIDSAHKNEKITLITVHHEQAAAFAAEGMARLTGIPGVALATSGPGAINLLTGIGSCYYDSVPAIFITGQVNRNEQKKDLPIRQLGFQETDIVTMSIPITKAAWKIDDPLDVPTKLEEAFSLALSGRPGPVLLDIPMDVQRMDIPYNKIKKINMSRVKPEKDEVRSIFTHILEAKRPLIIAGGGIRSSGSIKLFRKLVNEIKVPVINSLMAVDALPFRQPNRVGLIGSYGNRWANLAIGEADSLFIFGSRLDVRITGSDIDSFSRGRKIFQIDIDEGEINQRVKVNQYVHSDIREFIKIALQVDHEFVIPDFSSWQQRINVLKAKWLDISENKVTDYSNPNMLIHRISAASKKAHGYIVDVGNHQMWAAQSIELEDDQFFLTSGGMGAMGFALPTAIGSSYAVKNKPVMVIAGDGGMQMNIQELETIAYHKLPIKIVIINNHSLGMVRQFQQSYFDERYEATLWGYSSPDFEQVSHAYGIESFSVNSDSQLSEGIIRMWNDPTIPFLLQVNIPAEINAYPKIAFGSPMTEMEPFINLNGTE